MKLEFLETQHKRIVALSSAAIVFGIFALKQTISVLSAYGFYESILASRPEVYQFAVTLIVIGMVLNILYRSFQDESREKYLQQHDLLTGLPNRASFMDMLQALSAAQQLSGAIILINPERLRSINNSLGHKAGDEVFVEFSRRLKYLFSDSHIVAVVNNGTFGVLVRGISKAESITAVTREIGKAFSIPVQFGERMIYSNLTAGAVLLTGNSAKVGDLLNRAELALLEAKAKRDGKPVVFNSGLQDSITQRSNLETELREVLENDGLIPFFQPLFEEDGKTVVGFEALARWPHPEKGWISPGSFVPIAESLNLGAKLGRLMMLKACMQIAPFGNLKVAVNVTSTHLLEDDFVDQVRNILEESGLAANRLEIEIVESVLLEETDKTVDRIRQIRELGVSVALDDFGTGYSGLSYLNRFTVDRIKVDASFIQDTDTSMSARSMVESIISMAQERNIAVTVEGVETQEQYFFLRQFSNLVYQGYLFSPPMPIADLAGSKIMERHHMQMYSEDREDDAKAANRMIRTEPFHNPAQAMPES